MPSADARDAGEQAEKYIARREDGEHHPEAWYDVTDRGGTIREVKSAKRRVKNGDYTRLGRFRLRKEQHINLRDHGGKYDFLLRSGEEKTLSPDEVDDLIDEHDVSWTSPGPHAKLKVDAVFPEVFDS
jgi:hypothetical protein